MVGGNPSPTCREWSYNDSGVEEGQVRSGESTESILKTPISTGPGHGEFDQPRRATGVPVRFVTSDGPGGKGRSRGTRGVETGSEPGSLMSPRRYTFRDDVAPSPFVISGLVDGSDGVEFKGRTNPGNETEGLFRWYLEQLQKHSNGCFQTILPRLGPV